VRQIAPDPEPLHRLVSQLTYKRDWRIWLEDTDRGQGSEGLTLIIQRCGPDTYHPERTMRVNHYMPVPPAAFDERSWQRWLFDQVLLVERHECCEFFQIAGKRPYAPSHGPGNDPYLIRETGTVADAETSFRGVRDEGIQT
jgi:hypothetical protein